MLRHFRALASESLVYGLSGVLTRFITVFLVPLYTRALTPADYGTMSLVRNTTILLGMCTSLALDSAAHRLYWDTEESAGRKSTLASWAWCHVTVATVAALVVIVFANELSVSLVDTAAAASSLRFAAGALPLSVFGIVFMNSLRMQRRPWAVTIYALVTSILTVASTAVLVLGFHRGVEGAFAAQFGVSLVTAFFVIAYAREWIHPGYFQLERLKAMLRYCLPLIPTTIAFWVVDAIDRYFLRAYASVSEVGIYEIGYSIAAIVALGTVAFQQAWVPFAMSIKDLPEARHVYAQTLVAYVWIGCVACAGAAIFAREALSLLTTQAYYGAETVVASLAFAYLLMGAGNIAALGAAVTKRTISMGVAVLGGATANVGLNFWLTPLYGKDGAALATLLSSAVVPIYLFFKSQQLYPIPYRFGKPILIILFSLLMVKIGTNVVLDSAWLTVLTKTALVSLFIPLLFVLRIVTLAQVRTIIRGGLTWPLKIRAAEWR